MNIPYRGFPVTNYLNTSAFRPSGSGELQTTLRRRAPRDQVRLGTVSLLPQTLDSSSEWCILFEQTDKCTCLGTVPAATTDIGF